MNLVERRAVRLPVEWFVPIFAALVVLVAGSPGCKKKRKMRCRYPDATLKKLRQQSDDPQLTDKQRGAQIRSMFKHCTGLDSSGDRRQNER